MAGTAKRGLFSGDGIAAPLRHALFRRIWLASLLSNLGLMINGVGAAWAMTQMTASADMVALVQTALMLPIMLVAMPAGAIADMYDRRLVALAALGIGLAGATTLAAFAHLGLVTPNNLLLFCFVIGTGMALFGPSWQASVSEQVPAETLPAAVALNGISYNIARSFGPAVGGIVVAAAGAVAAFAANAVLYLPLLIVLLLWRRVSDPPRLPPERLNRAIVSGVRYITNSPAIRIVLTRTLVTGVAGSSVLALMPLVARDLLHSGAETYGLLLGAFGIGAVIGALNVGIARQRLSSEAAVRLCAMIMGVAMAVVAISRSPLLTAAALVIAGAVWMLAIALFNIGVQLSAPRWVAGRSLAAFQASISGGIAIGSWGWGHVADLAGVAPSMLLSGLAMLASPVLAFLLPMPPVGTRTEDAELLADPEVKLALTSRSGPVVIEIDYRVDAEEARAFHNVMQEVQLSRQRNGAYGWSIARDVADPELWTERYHCPTWLDYLRQRSRSTQEDRALHRRAIAFHRGSEPVRVRRMLERPFGSVRWKDESPDRTAATEVLPVAGVSGGST
ncbi:putative MFS family arabinose efflux permease [Rhodopseudomonas thermotolerans]|uniref:MFS family arabinose efflux permease n=2 Tax=Rhodopseudomonas TaxID=1073 RepID=A0A336JY77_9BRAD|nr:MULTISPECIES: MFS transporter [Rhodopseudomonas]RED21553.1 putative MFS family arabinose efflux permease [Rhodopseudomonas pentothenatexigens]REF86923.1 putative MFS family arabinose efflux permease [Rhodopseudomonas thermotolerans]SSW93673.1 predicted MFS family arabinose efflux permease [Rhodopseudomonas pentothenatexigens]